MKDIISGYRNMLGKTQQEMANILGVSRQSYYLKEKGEVPFADKEKITFKGLVSEIIPGITIDDIFFTYDSKKCKEKRAKQ